jgi:uncharacterized BrkB/YihY/UPF0761 family membrane protein
MDNAGGLIALSLFSVFYIVIICGAILFTIATIWLFIACLMHLINKTEAEFPERTTWLIILIITFVLGLSLIPTIIYYFMYKPRLKFWEK